MKIILDKPENQRNNINLFLISNVEKIIVNSYGAYCVSKFVINNSNLNLSSYFLRGPSNMKSSFNIFNPSLNNSYFSMSKRGSQFNIFNSKSRISSENY